MKVYEQPPVFDRDEFYDSSARMIRWIVLALVAITFPFSKESGLIVATLLGFVASYNALMYWPKFRHAKFLASRIHTLSFDHITVLVIIGVTGGLASPYYPLFYLLMIGTIASFGIAGFAFSLSVQVIITLVLMRISLEPLPATPEYQFIIKLVLLIIFSLVAEQSVKSRDEEYLLETKFTSRIDSERQRLLALINSLSNAVLAVDRHGKVYLYNAAALELLNTNRDINGESLSDLLKLHDAKGQHIDPLVAVRDQGRLVNRQDLRLTASDDSQIILDLTISPVHDISAPRRDELDGYMAVFRDITKQKTLDEERDEFISVTSHELRTPLAIAEANLSTALLPGFAKIEDKAKQLIVQAHNNVIFLGDLIKDLTSLARAERDDVKIEKELVDIEGLVQQLQQDYASTAKDKHLLLKMEDQSAVRTIYTSRHDLQEIMQNFLTNAIKYTASGTVTIFTASDKNRVTLGVKDTGIGISASDKAKIFEKFYRSEDYRTRQTGGTGLGLYITKKLATRLSAEILFESKLNHGSSFGIVIAGDSAPSSKRLHDA